MKTKPYNLDELYPDDPPRRPASAPVVIYHEFGTPVTNRPGALRVQQRTAGASRFSAAWLAFRIMLMVLGGVVSIAYTAALPRFLQIAAVGVAVLVFFLLYTMIRCWPHGR